MRMCDWQVAQVTPAIGCEFHVRLRRGGIKAAHALSEAVLDARRLALMQSMLDEAAEQLAYARGAS